MKPFGFDARKGMGRRLSERMVTMMSSTSMMMQMMPQEIQNDYLGIMRTMLPLDQATMMANQINAGMQTEIQYVDGLLSQAGKQCRE